MRERINQLAQGIIDKDVRKLVIVPASFTRSVPAGEVTREVLAVTDEGGRSIKGLAYSSNIRVRVTNSAFGGVRNRIAFEIDSTYLTQEDVITGALYLVTSAGERKVPYSFSIDSIEAEDSGKTLKDLKTAKDFARIAQKDQETALRLFEYQDFGEAPFMRDIHVRALYDGLKGKGDRQNLLEEFLVALKAKKPVKLELEKRYLAFEKLDKPAKGQLEVHASTWGYAKFQVTAEGDFLELPKRFFGPQDFKEGVCLVDYVVNPARLHGGRNLGTFTLSGIRESMVVRVEARGYDQDLALPREGGRENLGRYLKVRLEYEAGSGNSRQLLNQMRQEVEGLRRRGGETLLNVLLQAELNILEGQKGRAGKLLDSHGAKLLQLRRDKPEQYCFYQYLLQLLRRKEGQRDVLVGLVKKCLLEEGGHPYLLFLWMKLDPELSENPTELLEQIRRLFDRGCKSPFLYLHALRVYEKIPLLMQQMGELEIQVMNFSVKRGLLGRELALRTAELADAAKGYHRLYHGILAALYEKYREKEFLRAACAMLLKGDCRGEGYFPWYQKAMDEGVGLPRLYEYFLYSLPEGYPRLLPREVLLYFSYEKTMDDYIRSQLYVNILTYMKPEEELYKHYLRDIEQFTMEQLLGSRVNGRLVVLYRHMIYKGMIDQRVARVLPSVLRSYRIRVDNPEIKAVVVSYEELDEESLFPVVDGTAYVPLFLERPVLLFQDGQGNRYANIPYQKAPAMEGPDVLDLESRCYEIYPGHEMLRLRECAQIMDAGFLGESDVLMLERISSGLKVKPLFRKKILAQMIQYYQGHPEDGGQGDFVADYLMGLDMERMDRQERAGVCGILIQKNRMREAWERVRRYGCEGMDSAKLLKMCSSLVSWKTGDEGGKLLLLACSLFSQGKYDPVTMNYLCRCFNGSGKQMFKILNQAVRGKGKVYDLPERLLAQMLFTGETDRVDQVFDWYMAEKEAMQELVKAYFTMKSADYFLKGRITRDRVFTYLEGVVRDFPDWQRMPTIYLLALARYYAGLPVLGEGQKKLCQVMVDHLLSQGLTFSWFRDLGKWVSVPDSIMNQVMVEYHGSRDVKPELQVRILPDEEEYHWEEMRPVCLGIFVRQKVLFEGEILEYQIFERRDGEPVLTGEGSLSWEPGPRRDRGSRFSALNEMGLCLSLKEEPALREKMKKYVTDNVAMEELFGLM
ncbi:MAG: hypothetical protein HFG60_12910 [Lachnospiraceae bacterium]|nr:hypothetical protein [Lachnospiraceae bacterium]